MYKRDIYLDIDDELNNYIKSVELDSNSRVWHFHLMVDYKPLDLTGKSVHFIAEKPDKTNVLNDCKIVDAEKGVVEVKLTRQVNAIPGHVKCLLKIIGDEGFVLKTKTFVVDVSKTLSDDAVVSSDEFGALEVALGKVQDIDNRFAQTNAQLSEVEIDKVSKSYIYIDDFKELGDIDDTASIQRAIDYSVSQPQIPIIIFSQKKYITSSPIILRSKVVLCGGYTNDEYKAKAVIKNVTSDIFKVEETSVIGYNLLSLCFEGNDNNKLFETQPYEKYFHKWGKIQKCGFKHFKEVFGEIQFVGFRLYDLFINNVNHIGTIYGSDNYLQQWFVSHNKGGERYQNSLVIKSPLTVIRDIFWTGHLETGYGPESLLNIFGSNTYGVRVESCTFDYCDSYAIRVDVNARHIVIANNTFRGTNRVDTDRAIIEFHTSKNVSVYGNSFEHVHQGVENLTPIFYSFSGYGTHPAKDIVIYQNHYEQDHVFNVKKDFNCYKNVKIYENQFPYDNRVILTKTENFDGMNVDEIDVINSNVTSDFNLSSLTGSPHQGKVLEIYNFSSANTITVVQGLFKNKIPGDKVIERQSCARYIYHVNSWWEM